MPPFLLIVLLGAFPALSTDMYLPAIPTLQDIWGISLEAANLSLVAYFATFSVMLLVHGPLADRFGRKPVLFGGILLFIAACGLCAAADSIVWLVAARMAQATGAAAAAALSLALAKDLYTGTQRQKVLAYIGVIIPLCPMVAPTIGGLLLTHLSWRWIFILQGTLALVAFYGTMRLKEPQVEKTFGGVLAVLGRYRVLLANGPYLVYTAAFSILPAGFFAYIAASSDIYITGYGASPQAYGVYFGINALCLMAGSLLCSRLCVGYSQLAVLRFSLVGLLGAGVFLFAVPPATASHFLVDMGAISFCVGLSRPMSVDLVLEQVETDIGSASALVTFGFFFIGAVAMEVVSLDWPSKTAFIGWLTTAGALVPLAVLALLHRARRRRMA